MKKVKMNDYTKPENPVICHYRYDNYRLIVKKEPVSNGYISYYLYIEEKSTDSLGNEIWLPYLKVQIPEPCETGGFPSQCGTTKINEVFATLVAILLYKQQDLLVEVEQK